MAQSIDQGEEAVLGHVIRVGVLAEDRITPAQRTATEAAPYANHSESRQNKRRQNCNPPARRVCRTKEQTPPQKRKQAPDDEAKEHPANDGIAVPDHSEDNLVVLRFAEILERQRTEAHLELL